MKKFHVWDLERVNIRITKEFLTKINNAILSRFESKENAWREIFNKNKIPLSTFKNILKQSTQKSFFIPLDIILNICDFFIISRGELEKSISAYKTAGGINYVELPILPIKITPVFNMLFAHNIGDGTVINPKKGRLPYFGYRQFDEFYRISYVKKVEEVFGKIKYKHDYFLRSTRPHIPAVLSSLFFRYYNLTIKDFLSERARVPDTIFKDGKESLLAVLVAFIIDEGNIDSTQISINLKNEYLIKDLMKICKLLNYKSKIVQNRIAPNYWRLNILREGMKRFYEDYLILNKEYVVIDLGKKGEKIKNSFKIYARKLYKVKGNEELVLEILNKEQLSVNQLAERLAMTRQGIRYHIKNLINQRKIKIIDKNELNWIYGI